LPKAPPGNVHRKASLHFGLGANEISQPFHLDEIKLAVLESSAGELTLDRHPNTRSIAKRVKQRRQHGSAAVDLQLANILAGKRIRSRKKQHQAAINRLIVTSPNRSVRRMPSFWNGSDELHQNVSGQRAADSND
jgi:hypothetical protein